MIWRATNVHHARTLFGEEPVRVFGCQEPGLEVDDAASIMLEFSGGRAAQISVGFNAFNSQYAEISGPLGLLELQSVWNNENRSVKLQHHSNYGLKTYRFEPSFQFALQLQHMCQCLQTGSPHRIPPEDSVAQMRVLDAVKELMEQGRAVAITER